MYYYHNHLHVQWNSRDSIAFVVWYNIHLAWYQVKVNPKRILSLLNAVYYLNINARII